MLSMGLITIDPLKEIAENIPDIIGLCPLAPSSRSPLTS
jgi:hypothetical protein